MATSKGSTVDGAPRSDTRQLGEDDEPVGSSRKLKESSDVPIRQKASIKCETSTLYVSNLHPRITETHLELLFKTYGEITRVYFVRKRSDFGTVGFAFVEYKSINSAKLAIEKVDGRSLLGKFLVVRPAHNRKRPDVGRCGVDRTSNGVSTEKASDVVKSGDIKLINKHRYAVESKIEAVKRAIEDARKKRRID